MVAKKSTLKGIIFILVLIVVVMGYSMYTTSVANKKEVYVADQKNALDTQSSVESLSAEQEKTSQSSPTVEDTTKTQQVSSADSVSQCEKDFSAQLKQNKTEYEKGRILVGFNKDISFSKAQSVVARYDLTPVLAGVDEESYLLTRLLSVNVPTGRESHFVCVFKQDTSVRYSNISAYLFLHD